MTTFTRVAVLPIPPVCSAFERASITTTLRHARLSDDCRLLERGHAMRVVLAIVTSVVVLGGMQSPARGTEEWSFEAIQPIWTVNALYLSHVTVLTFNSGETGIYAVLATCDSNRVMTDYGPQQRNAAFEVGLRAEVTYNGNREPPLFGDTLRVVLRATKPPADIDDFSYSTILAATVKCILLNAAQSAVIKFVALRVEGNESFTNYGGVYATARFRNGPRRREFRGAGGL